MRKTEMLERVRAAHDRLLKALDGLTEERAAQKGLNPEWSIKDALAHIVAWEKAGARTVRDIQQGTGTAPRLSRDDINDFNARAVEERQGHSLREMTDELNVAHEEMQRLIESLPDEIEESSPVYKLIEGVTFKHLAQHAAQIENYRNK